MRIANILPSVLFLIVSCVGSDCKITDDGVIVNVQSPVIDGPSKVRLQVMSDRIVRVSATPDRSFRDRNSLIILPDAKSETGFVVHNHKETVDLQTSGLR